MPGMNISFTPSATVGGSGTVTLAVTSPLGVPVFAAATPAQAGVLIVGLPNCTNATAAINAANQTLTITLPSSCILAGKVPVRIEIPDAFFAPNPGAGTTVTLSLTTSASLVPAISPGYTIGMRLSPLPLPCWRHWAFEALGALPQGRRGWLERLALAMNTNHFHKSKEIKMYTKGKHVAMNTGVHELVFLKVKITRSGQQNKKFVGWGRFTDWSCLALSGVDHTVLVQPTCNVFVEQCR